MFPEGTQASVLFEAWECGNVKPSELPSTPRTAGCERRAPLPDITSLTGNSHRSPSRGAGCLQSRGGAGCMASQGHHP